jgi:hypothetical protein
MTTNLVSRFGSRWGANQPIVDRLRAHLTREVAAWVTAHRERLELFYLACYAPELNADE